MESTTWCQKGRHNINIYERHVMTSNLSSIQRNDIKQARTFQLISRHWLLWRTFILSLNKIRWNPKEKRLWVSKNVGSGTFKMLCHPPPPPRNQAWSRFSIFNMRHNAIFTINVRMDDIPRWTMQPFVDYLLDHNTCSNSLSLILLFNFSLEFATWSCPMTTINHYHDLLRGEWGWMDPKSHDYH